MRRVVIANRDGVSQVVADGPPPRSREARLTPGFSNTLLWQTTGNASSGDGDPSLSASSFVPGPHGSSWLRLVLPPAASLQGLHGGAEAAEEHRLVSPGIAELMERDHPGMHTTPTTDYVFVLSGVVTLELSDGEVELHAGDTVVQQETRHAWRNWSDDPVELLIVLLG
jgi:mannose-6-phosphate isomerase-like protein (cupin superfamily)